MKYLLLLVVLAVAGFILFGRRRPPPPPASGRTSTGPARDPQAPQVMLACAHCGLHLPQAEARMDAAGRAYCNDAHRLLGPR
ncbi:MAG: hypothetical protein JNK55_09745 [Rubrivivax sp.]|nr:hypothetical protein [Rubrivivax sp.]